MTSSFWFQDTSGGGGGDAGDPIGQSLRFRGTQQQVLTFNSFPSTTKADACFSFWMKLGVQTASTTSHALSMICYGAVGAGVDLRIANHGQFHDGASHPGPQYYRDNSGWYHCFIRYTASSGLQEVYVNGVLQYSKVYSYSAAINGTLFQIGNTTAYPWNYFQYVGYMADYHYVYGQSLSPETFGRLNEEGVWVPVDPKKDGDTAWYGTNGFHLTFADPGDVGKDYSGNGNDFTATGFDTTSFAGGWYVDNANSAVGNEFVNSINPVYVDNVQPANASSGATGGIENLFDGNLNSIASNQWSTIYIAYNIANSVTSMDIDLRDFPTVNDVAIFAYNAGGNTTAYAYAGVLLDASRNEIPGTYTEVINTSSLLIWVDIPVAGTPRYLRIRKGDNATQQNIQIAGIRINGQVLSQAATTAPTYDIMQDSPTNNFATGNPLHLNGTPANANLGFASVATWGKMSSTIELPDTGNRYWEYTATTKYATYVGMQDLDINQTTTTPNTVGYWNVASDAAIYTDGVISVNPNGQMSDGDVLGFQYDRDNDELRIYRNNVLYHTFTLPAVGTRKLAAFVGNYQNTNTFNFGQQPFRYTPPEGFEPLSTANMPAAPIANGKDHFQAITGPGSSGGVLWLESTTDPGNVTFPLGTLTSPIYNGSLSGPFIGPAYTFIWDAGGEINGPITLNFVPQSGNHSYAASLDGQTWFGVFSDNGTTITINPGQPFRYVRKYSTVAGNQGYSTSDGIPILGSAQAAFPSGLWWIKDRANANQHQLVDSVRGGDLTLTSPTLTAETAYTPPTGESVAWCWNYNSSNPSTNGFEIITYTGDGTATNRTINHNLGATPQMMIVKCRETNSFQVYHSGVDATNPENYVMWMDVSNARQTLDVWGNTAPTSSDFTVKYDNSVVRTNGPITNTFVAYLWTSVPGYSAFGSYTGNSNADGPFVYLGFRPAFVMFKTITATNWSIHDNARAPYNPCVNDLVPNSTTGESGAAMDVDFLSNGFKVKIGNANINSSTVVYAAFAENPFQSPVTAR